jgi:tRNA-modifying protein YgfZ
MKIDLGRPAILEFSGPDAVRFLNGQVTQDVRKVVGSGLSLPACVTDAKGKLQFRVWITEAPQGGAIWILCENAGSGELEARLTRYLIADDVEVRDRSGEFGVWHVSEEPAEGAGRQANRFGFQGFDLIGDFTFEDAVSREELERLRIENGIPAWGAELREGMLPPEAGLDRTDISYTKGCYIGQEVISRIKSAGKVNRRLVKLRFDEASQPGELLTAEGKSAGEATSVRGTSGLGFVKRGMEEEPLFLGGKRAQVILLF